MLADWRQGPDGCELDLEAGRLTLATADGETMSARPGRGRQLGEDAVICLPRLGVSRLFRKPIGLDAYEEARAKILCEAKELVDVALSIGGG